MDTTTLHLSHWAEAMTADCGRAQSEIVLSALSLLPPRTSTAGEWPALWEALKAACKKKVKVEIYLPKPNAINPATKANYTTAAAAEAAGMICRLLPGPRLLHCKSMVIDRQIVWIGSGNFTAAAAHFNHEAYTRSVRADFACAMLERWKALS